MHKQSLKNAESAGLPSYLLANEHIQLFASVNPNTQLSLGRGEDRPGFLRVKDLRQLEREGRSPFKSAEEMYKSPMVLPKTDYQRVKELKELMIKSGGKNVAQKVIDIALNDEHPGQMAAIKMCLDRALPISLFEKDKQQRSAVTINITGIGGDIIDV